MEDQNQENGPEPKSALWKLQNVVFEPGKAFDEIGRNPTWLVPVLLAMIFSFTSVSAFLQVIGAEEIVVMSMEAQGQEIPEGQLDTIVSVTAASMYGGAILFPPIMLLAVSGVYLLCFLLIGGEGTFRKFFSVVSHAFVIFALIGLILGSLVLFLTPDPSDIDIQNPVASNLGFLFDAQESPALFTLGAAIDLPTFYFLYLVGLGLAIVSRLRAVGGGLVTTFGVYAAWTLIKMGWAAFV